MEVMFLLFHWWEETQSATTAHQLDMITSNLERPWHDNCIVCSYDDTGADLENSLYAFSQSEKS